MVSASSHPLFTVADHGRLVQRINGTGDETHVTILNASALREPRLLRLLLT
jgi:hypothetical protein